MASTDHSPGEDFQARLERLASIVEHSYDAIVGKSLDGIVTDWNPAAERTYGWTSEEMVGHSIKAIFPDDRLHEYEEIIAKLRRGEEVGTYETERKRKDGSRFPVLVTVSPIRNKDGHIVGGSKVARDLTNVRRAETAEALVRARDEFLAIASHELRTPVASLSGFVQLLMRRKARGTLTDAQLDHALHQIFDGAHRLTNLVDQLLDLSRIESGQLRLDMERVDLATVTDRVVQGYRLNGAMPVTVQTSGDATVQADPLRMEQVVRNLVDNAIKYSPDGTPVDVGVDRVNGEVRLAVRDRGLGVPEAERERIFERFHRAHVDYAQGMGIGLYLTRQIVEQHGGRIYHEHAPGGGAQFIVTLPSAEQ